MRWPLIRSGQRYWQCGPCASRSGRAKRSFWRGPGTPSSGAATAKAFCLAADATHAADPKALRVVNNCCLFGEYVADRRTYKGKQTRAMRTPLQYLRAVLKAGVNFDAIGLQVYYPEHDKSKAVGAGVAV